MAIYQRKSGIMQKINKCEILKISSFKGIKYFPNLKYLDCGHNNLTSLDLSGNKKLENSTVIIISLQLCRPETHRNSEHCIVVIIA